MKKIKRVNGPYVSKTTKRRVVSIFYEDGTKKGTTYARYLMEQHLGVELPRTVDVDHIDGDKTNDALENLQVLTKSENIRKYWRDESEGHQVRPPAEVWTFTCPICGGEGKREARKIRSALKTCASGPFCSPRCGSRHAMNVRWHGSPAVRPTLSA